MTMKKLMLALAAIAAVTALGGCFKFDKTPPKNLPAYVRLYPGSTQMMNMSMGSVMVDAATTPDTPDTVLAYYRTQAAGDGLTETAPPANAAPAPDQKAIAFEGPDKMLAVVVKPQTSGAGTTVTLSWTVPGKGACMSGTRLILALAAVAALGGCSSRSTRRRRRTPPAYVQLYPGSTQVMNAHGHGAGLTVDGATTPDNVDTVLAFYRTQAAADGLTETTPPADQPLPTRARRQLAFEGPGEFLAVVTQARGRIWNVLVTPSWSTPKKAASHEHRLRVLRPRPSTWQARPARSATIAARCCWW